MYGKGCRGRRKTRSRSRKSRRPFLGGKVAPFLWLQLIKGAGVIILMIGLMIGYLAQLGLMIGPIARDWEAGPGCQRLESRRPETGRPDLGVRG